LGQADGRGLRLLGTGFFVSVPGVGGAADEKKHVYLVTAAHCLTDPRGQVLTNLFVQVNDPQSGLVPIALPNDSFWLFPDDGPNGYLDIAICPWPDPDWALAAGYRWVPISMFFSEQELSDDPNLGFGVGDEVVALGLLLTHTGVSRNATIVRSGHLALIPPDPVRVERFGADLRVYLIEMYATAGISGAPVFGRLRHAIGVPNVRMALLGMCIGHWFYREETNDPLEHTGIGMVVPAWVLRDALYRQEFIDDRKERDERGG
jgi:hypothetical protein